MNKIIRVFPTKTKLTPNDEYCFYGYPEMFIPDHTEVHISTVFTWDIEKAKELKYFWEGATDKKVKVGGPAFDDPGGEFEPGLYVKKGVVITSRGCPKKCKFCFVPKREGRIREIRIREGNIINDNNLLACSKEHIEKVFKMLEKQRNIEFKGGLEASRISHKIGKRLKEIKAQEIWLACDKPKDLKKTLNAIKILKECGFKRDNIRVYVLTGFNIKEELERLKEIVKSGAYPFAQLYQPELRIHYNREWKDFIRIWSRPAMYKAYLKSIETN